MKLHARKSILALGTAAALAFSAVNPAIAADENSSDETMVSNESPTGGEQPQPEKPGKDDDTNPSDPAGAKDAVREALCGSTKAPESTETPDKKYSTLYTQVTNELNTLVKRAKDLEDNIETRERDIKDDPAAARNLESAKTNLKNAQYRLGSVKGDYCRLPKESNGDSGDYGILSGLDKSIREADRDIDAGVKDYRAAVPVSCEGTKSNTDNSGSSAFGSLFDSLGSSGRMSIVKDGKKTCVSKAEYYSEKLTKIVAILGTVFTLITTMTKISDTIQKQALPR